MDYFESDSNLSFNELLFLSIRSLVFAELLSNPSVNFSLIYFIIEVSPSSILSYNPLDISRISLFNVL